MRPLVILSLIWWWVGLGAVSRVSAGEQCAGVDDKWRCYHSPHFELFSRNDGAASRQLLHNLEFLHTVFLGTLHLNERRPVEVTVYYFGNERDFRTYLPPAMRSNDRLGGFYLNRPDRAVIVLPPQEDSEEARRLIYHEYIHHLTFITGDTPALWYLEGIAELFSTIKEQPDGLILGKPIEGHVAFLQLHGLMPLDALFSTMHDSPNYNESTRAGYFYAESWALLHYWLFGKSHLSKEGLERFISYSRRDDGNLEPAKRRELFKTATGMDYAAMADHLKNYVIHGHYGSSKLPLPKMAAREDYTLRPVTRDEIREQLTELSFRVTRDPLAKLALLDGIEQHPGEPRRFELLGADALVDGDDAAAREQWLHALAAGSRNPAVFHELAMLESRRWFARFDLIYFRLPEETAHYLRTLLHRSIERAPNQIQAYEMLAWVEAMSDQPSAANVNLVQAHFNGLKEKNRTLLALALTRVRAKDEKSAREMLDDLEGLEPGEDLMRHVTTVRQFLDGQHPAEPETGTAEDVPPEKK